MKTIRSTMLALALLSAACGEEAAPPPPPAVAPKPKAPAAPAATATTAEPAKPTYVYSYNQSGKRDPFRAPEEILNPGGNRQDLVSACSEPLCQWDLDQLQLVAVVTGDANPVAMVEDPLGRGHVVRRNTKMGRQGGKVTQILRDAVTVTEYFPGADGKLQSNQVPLKLKSEARLEPLFDLSRGKNWEPQ